MKLLTRTIADSIKTHCVKLNWVWQCQTCLVNFVTISEELVVNCHITGIILVTYFIMLLIFLL